MESLNKTSHNLKSLNTFKKNQFMVDSYQPVKLKFNRQLEKVYIFFIRKVLKLTFSGYTFNFFDIFLYKVELWVVYDFVVLSHPIDYGQNRFSLLQTYYM